MYDLYTINKKTGNMAKLLTDTIGRLRREMNFRFPLDKDNHYAIYFGNELQCSTVSGGANPHAWAAKGSPNSRKRSGLKAWRG